MDNSGPLFYWGLGLGVLRFAMPSFGLQRAEVLQEALPWFLKGCIRGLWGFTSWGVMVHPRASAFFFAGAVICVGHMGVSDNKGYLILASLQ